MKKVVSIIGVISLVLSVCGFFSYFIPTRSNTISEINSTESPTIENNATKDPKEPKETFAETTENLDSLINSNSYSSWNKAALRKDINAEQLKTIAIKCAAITDNKNWAQTIANSICDNSTSNDSIINELSNSTYYTVLNIAVNSEYANKLTLKNVAIKCAAITDNSNWAQTIASSISKNTHTDDDIMNELSKSSYYTVLNLVAKSDRISESTLKSIATRCAAITDNKNWAQTIANSISNNSVANDNIMNELTNSNYYAVLNIIANSDYSNVIALKNVAVRCANIKDNSNWAQTIASSISKNTYADDIIMNELTNSEYYAVLNIAANSDYSNIITLKNVAIKCAAITDNKNWAQTIANSISNNHNTTPEVLKILSTSIYENIAKLGQVETEN